MTETNHIWPLTHVCLSYPIFQTPKMNGRRGRKRFTSSPPLRKCAVLCRRMLVISLFVGCGLMFKVAIASLEWSDGKNLSSFYKNLAAKSLYLPLNESGCL